VDIMRFSIARRVFKGRKIVAYDCVDILGNCVRLSVAEVFNLASSNRMDNARVDSSQQHLVGINVGLSSLPRVNI
jgi:hypothetical protein